MEDVCASRMRHLLLGLRTSYRTEPWRAGHKFSGQDKQNKPVQGLLHSHERALQEELEVIPSAIDYQSSTSQIHTLRSIPRKQLRGTTMIRYPATKLLC